MANTIGTYPRGFRAQLEPEGVALLKALHQASIREPLLRVILAHAAIFTMMLAFCLTASDLLKVAIVFIALIVAAREQRVLELLVHDGSHRNWTRNKQLNDVLVSLAAGMPMLSDVTAYWESHRVHHHEYGSPRDPDRIRFVQAGRPDFQRPLHAARWLARYAIGYYLAIGSSPRSAARFVTWHCVVYLATLTTAFGLPTAASAWALLWALPMLLTLPILRAIAELEEHDYAAGTSEFGTTNTNLGWIHTLFVHPWHDEYHLVHHLYPGIPQFRHAEAHRLLWGSDVNYRTLRIRRSLLATPASGA